MHFRTATKLVINAGKKQCRNHLNSLKQHLNETLAKVRQTLATKVSHQDGDGGLAELEALLVMPTIEKVKGVLQDLLVSKNMTLKICACHINSFLPML